MDLLDRFLETERWIADRLLDVCASLPSTQLDEEFDIGHRTLRATLVHVLYNLDGWTAGMEGEPPHSIERNDFAYLRARWTTDFGRFATISRQIQAEGRLDETFLDSWDYPQTYGGVITHVILHNALHRSEIVHILARLGYPGLDDLDPTVWEHEVVGVPGTPAAA